MRVVAFGNNESEVLLPPGRFLVTSSSVHERYNKKIGGYVRNTLLEVRFIPDRSAKSLHGNVSFWPRARRNNAHPYPLHAILEGGRMYADGPNALKAVNNKIRFLEKEVQRRNITQAARDRNTRKLRALRAMKRKKMMHFS